MAVEITMPQLSDTMSEGKILVWRKNVGDAVKRGEALAEVATDKADLEIESFHNGQVLEIFAPVGTTVKVGSVIAMIGEAGEAAVTSSPSAAHQRPDFVQVESVPPSSISHSPDRSVVDVNTSSTLRSSEVSVGGDSRQTSAEPDSRVRISPLARNTALSHGVDYMVLKGSGEGGRILKRDIESIVGQNIDGQSIAGASAVESRLDNAKDSKLVPFAAAPVGSSPLASVPMPVRDSLAPTESALSKSPGASKPSGRQSSSGSANVGGSAEELSRMRQTIANRMVESKTTIPHFYMTTKVVCEALTNTRNSLKPLAQYEGITFTHLIIKAAALGLRACPRVNAGFSDGRLAQPGEINVGIVTAVPDGLLIPVLKSADQLSLADIVADSRALVQRARSGRPKADDLVGGTFSISNVGMFPVESFSAIINPGQGGILAVSAIQEEPIVRNGAVVPGYVLRMTLSVDHRIIDGVLAGEFLKEVKRLLEDPILLLA